MSKSSNQDSVSVRNYAQTALSRDSVHGTAALSLVMAETLHKAIVSVLKVGDAMLIGQTRDGGAVVIQMFSGDRVDKLYASTVEELQELLEGILEVANN